MPSSKTSRAPGGQPGLLACRDGGPVGWIGVAPRAEYPRLNRSPHTRPVDDLPVWSVTCFWVPRSHRGTHVATELLAGAGVELFRRAGFTEIAGRAAKGSRRDARDLS